MYCTVSLCFTYEYIDICGSLSLQSFIHAFVHSVNGYYKHEGKLIQIKFSHGPYILLQKVSALAGSKIWLFFFCSSIKCTSSSDVDTE